MSHIVEQVGRFLREIVHLPIPATPTMMGPSRVGWFGHAVREELKEFEDATTLVDQVDAVGDLAYFAIGRLFEMGVDPVAHLTAIHNANMRKERGSLSKRPGSMGHDAVKPAGWYGPEDEHRRLIDQRTREAQAAAQSDAEPRRPLKVLLLGHARHGKDTVAELLRDRHGFSFQSSSMFVAERVVMPHFALAGSPYGDVESCYEDRVNHRALWYDLIRAYNHEDEARLARELYRDFDVYVGLRAIDEFKAIEAARLFDLCIWVDRSDHVGPESASSCTVTPDLADVILDNNGTLEQTQSRLASILHGFRR